MNTQKIHRILTYDIKWFYYHRNRFSKSRLRFPATNILPQNTKHNRSGQSTQITAWHHTKLFQKTGQRKTRSYLSRHISIQIHVKYKSTAGISRLLADFSVFFPKLWISPDGRIVCAMTTKSMATPFEKSTHLILFLSVFFVKFIFSLSPFINLSDCISYTEYKDQLHYIILCRYPPVFHCNIFYYLRSSELPTYIRIYELYRLPQQAIIHTRTMFNILFAILKNLCILRSSLPSLYSL